MEGKQTHVVSRHTLPLVVVVSDLCVVDRRLSDTLLADDGVRRSSAVLHGTDPWAVQQARTRYCLEDMPSL